MIKFLSRGRGGRGGFAFLGLAACLAEPTWAADRVDFRREVEPLLAAHCVECHGPAKQKNGLRLDKKESVIKGGESGHPAVIPGKSAESLLLQLAKGGSEALDLPAMPPKGDPLTPAQIELLRRWIDEGAEWPDLSAAPAIKHWAFVKPTRPELPAVKNSEWARNEIDRFVLARLEKEGLAPSPEAERTALIRRVSLDLTGLPPTIEEVDAFLQDKAPDAYERVVDRLLASPRYGERWARPWLDLARYADTNGYEKDKPRKMWLWRDWVINALNANMPFDQFTIEQLAGDLLPNATEAQRIATGFHRNTMLNDEGGIDPEEFRMVAVIDRVNTTAETWLGLTLGCAQCHTHKYDPIPHADYYRFMAFLNSTQDNGRDPQPTLLKPSPGQRAALDKLAAELAALEARATETTPELLNRQFAWEKTIDSKPPSWAPLETISVRSANGTELRRLDDGSILAGGPNPESDDYAVVGSAKLKQITALGLEVLTDPSLPHGGPGRKDNGSFVLNRLRAIASPAGLPELSQTVAFKEAAADYSQAGHDPRALFGPDPPEKGSWAIEAFKEGFRVPRHVALEFDKPINADGGIALAVTLVQRFGGGHNVGRFRLSVTGDADAAARARIPDDVWKALAIPPEFRSKGQVDAVLGYYRTLDPKLMDLAKEIERKKKAIADFDQDSTMTLAELPEPRKTNILKRGDVFQKGDEVTPGVPGALGCPLPEGEPANRLGLARWIVRPDNPLTARVFVNRQWQAFFGRGIVGTPNDFGTRGDAPTHPELLDWLATEFMARKWDVKAVQKLIVCSATYRQSSRATPEATERDRYNVLLARGPRMRVDAEMVRDVALSAAGILSPEIGGPSVFPPQPAGVWESSFTIHDTKDRWIDAEGGARRRRAIYTYWRRTAPYPSALLFDAPRGEVCASMRSRTNTPLQALVTLNDPVFIEAAAALARRMASEAGPETRAGIERGFRLCVARAPEAGEIDILARLYEKSLARFESDPEAARELLAKGRAEAGGIEPARMAALVCVANALLNMDETLCKG